jgi:hypothetical protein
MSAVTAPTTLAAARLPDPTLLSFLTFGLSSVLRLRRIPEQRPCDRLDIHRSWPHFNRNPNLMAFALQL